MSKRNDVRKLAAIVAKLEASEQDGTLSRGSWHEAIHEAEKLELPEGADIEPVIAFGTPEWLPVE